MLVKMDKSEMSNLTLMNGKYYLFEIVDRKEPYVPALDAIKDKVQDYVIASESVNMAKKKAQEALSKRTIDEVAAFLNTTLKHQPPFRRMDPIPGIGVNSGITDAIFSGKPNSIINKVLTNGQNYYIIYVKDFTNAPMDGLPEQRSTIAQYILKSKTKQKHTTTI